jgi:hypothetical protein
LRSSRRTLAKVFANRCRRFSCNETKDRGWTSCRLHVDDDVKSAASMDVARSVPISVKLRRFSDLLRRPHAPIFSSVKRIDTMAPYRAKFRPQIVELCRIVQSPKEFSREVCAQYRRCLAARARGEADLFGSPVLSDFGRRGESATRGARLRSHPRCGSGP